MDQAGRNKKKERGVGRGQGGLRWIYLAKEGRGRSVLKGLFQ